MRWFLRHVLTRIVVYGLAVLTVVTLVLWWDARRVNRFDVQRGGGFTAGSAALSRPLTDPEFVSSDEDHSVGDYELVLGVAAGGQAKAYPIRFLSMGEHVNDRVGNRAICASW